MRQAKCHLDERGVIHIRVFQDGQAIPEQLLDLRLIGSAVANHIVKTPKKRGIKRIAMVRGGDDDALRGVLLDELQEHVERSPHFSHVVLAATLQTERVELVKQIYASSGLLCFEYQTQLGSAFTHELGDQRIETGYEQRQPQLGCENAGRQCLAGARRTNEQ